MGPVVRLIAVVGAAGCGRLGFDADVHADACTENCGRFDPLVGSCTDAEAGPFVQRGGPLASSGAGYGVWAAPPFVLAADTDGGLRSVRFDGASFVEVDRRPDLAWTEAVWSDGAHYFVGSPGNGFSVVALAADGTIDVLAQNTAPLKEARRGWSTNGTLYIPSGGDGLYAYRFDGATLTQLGESTATMSWAQGVWAAGGRVVLADADVLRVLDFNGTQFIDVVAPDTRHIGNTRVWSDGTTIFVSNKDGVAAYRQDGATLREVATYPMPSPARDIWSDGVHLFVAAEAAGLYALRFTDDQFVLVDNVVTGSGTLGVIGDGTFIYANDFDAGVRAFGGFACKRY